MILWPMGTLRAAEGGQSGMSSSDKLIYEIIKIAVVLTPMSLGAFMFIAACIGYGKPPAKWHVRSIVGCIGLLLVFLSLRSALVSK